MHKITEHDTETLSRRFIELQLGPINEYDAVGFNCDHEDCPWNSLDALEGELVSREVGAVR